MAPKFKRYMALFLTVVLVLSMSPAAFAAEDILSALEILESIQLPEATEAPEATEVPKATEVPEATEAPEATETPEVTEVPEATEAPEENEETPASEETQTSGEIVLSEVEQEAQQVLSETAVSLNEHYEANGSTLPAGNYILTDDLDLTADPGNLSIPAGAAVAIDLNGYVIQGTGDGSVITALSGSSLAVNDSSASGTGGITGGKAASGGGIHSLGSVTLNGGSIYGNDVGLAGEANKGGGIYCSGTVTMNGGKVYGNRAFSGGGIYASTVVLNGGVVGDDAVRITWSNGAVTQYPEIPDGNYIRIESFEAANKNTARRGGGVFAEKSLEMNGGVVAGNYAESLFTKDANGKTKQSYGFGGGIFNAGTAVIENHSMVYGNEADHNGGALYQTSGDSVTISDSKIACNYTDTYGAGMDAGGIININSGAKIIYNTAKNNGGGITVENSGKCTIDGGSISNNYAENSGGAFRCVGTLTIKAGDISYNRAKNGGAISARTDDTRTEEDEGGSVRIASVSITGGNIFYNKATSNGGGLHVEVQQGVQEPVTVNVQGASITNNEAGSNGGGLYLTAQSGGMHVALNSGSLSNNTAKYGGGIYMTVGASVEGSVTVVGMDVSENEATENGGGIYLTGGDFVLNGESALVQGNRAKNGGGVYLTGGVPNLYQGTISGNEATANGGGIYINQQQVVLAPTDAVTVSGNKAVDGAGMYIGGTASVPASFSVDDNAQGTVVLTGNIATGDGGAVCLDHGNFSITKDNITVTGNRAGSGGGIAVLDGNAKLSAGAIRQNTASGNGGGIAVSNGEFYMDGGSVDGNTSTSCLGGGIYVSAAGSDVTVDVLSGSVSSNTAAVSGGALAVVGKESGTDKITVTIGINENHYDGSGNLKTDLEHGTHGSCTCPVMTGNSSGVSGGAVYVTGNTNTALNIYCLTESGSSAAGENGHSDFMKMEGGKVNITTSEYLDDDNQTSVHGNTKLQNTIYVTGGQMDIWGAMTNPRIEDIITVDVVKEGDYFKDHRPVDSESYYKVLYFENFTDPDTGMTSGQYKEKEVKVTAKETISGSIYSHPGYTIVGWHTSPGGDEDELRVEASQNPATEAETKGWYKVGEEYLLIGDITLYAIWEQNGYTVIYDRNAPEGATYAGEMENQDFTYGVTGKLRKNAYTCLGYDFAGWNTKADGTGTSYADEADVLNLTTVKGEAVTLYAQWAPCNHDASHTYTYSLEDGGATLRRDCSCKAYFETVTLSAQDCVYDKAEHPAAVNYSSTVWKPAVVYSSGSTPVNAGTYTASVSGGGKTASVTYTIEKAEQPAPEKPTFEAVKMSDGSTKLNVYPVADSPLGTAGSSHYDGTYDSVAEYRVVYYDANGNEQTVDWVRDTDPGDSIAASFELPVALTNYYVYARYSEGTNYKNSEATRADSVYFFTGNVELIVECGDGVDYVPVAADGGSVVSGITLELSLEEGYYFPETFNLTIRTENDAGADHANPAVLTETEKYKTYAIGSIPNNSVIRVTIPGAKKLPTIDAWITEGQVFATVLDTSAIISRDSAFTAYFEVHDFASDVYGTPTLEFSDAIPAGTKLILLDKETNAYYSHVTGGSTSSLSLSSFTRMGGTGGYAAPDGELKLQLVVDYSETASGMTGSDQTVTISLAADTAKEPLAEDVDKSVTATLKNVSGFVLSASGTGLSQSITYNYNASAGTASIWNGRSTALVLTPGDTLPADAYMEYTVGSYSKAVYKNAAGNYVIPLSSVGDGSLTVRLVSRLFPDASTAYAMTAKWYVSDSKASAAPMNGYLAASRNITFTSGLGADISLKVTTDRRLYNVGDAATATVEWKNIPEACELTLTLTRKGGDGTYASTGWSKDISHNSATTATVSVPLGGQDAGSYCLELTVVSGLIELAEANYYFIIQNE